MIYELIVEWLDDGMTRKYEYSTRSEAEEAKKHFIERYGENAVRFMITWRMGGSYLGI